jgi:uncharacterized membrane protein YoaK (UPF0700 family)
MNPQPFSIRNFMLLGGFMAMLAGYINTILFLEFGLPVSQMTGIMSRLSESAFHQDWSLGFKGMMVLVGFIIGAMISGLVIGDRESPQDRRFAIGMVLLSVSLFISAWLASLMHLATLFTTALACGLQNALTAKYRGLQMRTTHVTGIVTDLGVYIARMFKGQGWPWQAWLLIILIVSFFVGGVFGIIMFAIWHGASLLIPAMACIPIALAWLRIAHKHKSPFRQ